MNDLKSDDKNLNNVSVKRSFPIVTFVLLIGLVVTFIVAASSLFLNYKLYIDFQNDNSESSQDGTKNNVTLETIDPDAISAVFQEANSSVVGIGILNGNTDNTVIGTGFVVSSDGYIATNLHVVSQEGVNYFVKFPEQDTIYNVTEIFRDQVNDIAIVKINASGLKPLTLGDSESVIPGQMVVAIGNPLGELNSTVTSGIVSAINRTVETNSGSFLRSSATRFEDTIQTDAAINPGNSGGPLLNLDGEVIGINFATIIDANNLSFAIPTSYLKSRLNEILEFGRFRIAYVGIGYRVNAYRLENKVVIGAEVTSVDENGSAAGILEIGDIITNFNGKSLEENNLFELIQTSDIGETVKVEFIRDEVTQTSEIEIIEKI